MSKKNSGIYIVKDYERKKTYCLVRQINDNEIEIRYLDQDDNPSGIVEIVSKADFDQRFIPPKYYFEGKIHRVNQLLAEAEKHVNQKQLQEAENKYNNALELAPENLKANLGKGNLYLKIGKPEKAKKIFTNISKYVLARLK